MKRLFAFVMAAMLICSLGVVAASANNSNQGNLLISTYVRSPERPSDPDEPDGPDIPNPPVDPDVPDVPDVPGEPDVPGDPDVPGADEPGSTPPDIPEQEDPEGEIPGVPVAPQTGYTVGVLGLSAVAAASGALAVAAGKKARKN